MKIQTRLQNRTTTLLCLLSVTFFPNLGKSAFDIFNGQDMKVVNAGTNGISYNFLRTNGCPIILRLAKVLGPVNTVPQMQLYGYDSNGFTFLGAASNSVVAELVYIKTNEFAFGFQVRVDTLNNSGAFTTNRLSFATASPNGVAGIYTVPGDGGGQMTNNYPHLGTIDVGDLDVWTFSATTSNSISIQVAKLAGGSSFTPSMRLYAPDGSLLTAATSITNAEYSFTAPFLGNYTLVVGDASAGLAGSGTYQLMETGIPTGLNFFNPVIQGTNIILRAAGGAGVVASNYVLFVSTNISQPLSSWIPIRTNQFDLYGTFSVTNVWSKTNPPQFFRFRTP